MRLIARIVLSIVSNAVAILGASYFIQGFIFNGSFPELLVASSIITFMNVFIRPALKLVLSPLIILSLGVFIIIINAFTIYILDILTVSIKINGLVPLVLGTLLISAINFVINFSAKSLYKKPV